MYLIELEIKRRELPTVRSSSGGSGERRFKVEAIPAKGWPGLDRISSGVRGGGEEAIGRGNLGGVARLRRIPARRSGGGSVSWGEGEGNAAQEKGLDQVL
jgi:hypothetical protein